MTLNKTELIHPVFYLVGLVLLSSLVSYNPNEWSLEKIGVIITTIFFYIILDLTKRIVKTDNEIVVGIHTFLGFIKVSNRIKLNEIKEVNMEQNSKKYYEIFVTANNGNKIVVKKIANKIPAEKEYLEIKLKISEKKI